MTTTSDNIEWRRCQVMECVRVSYDSVFYILEGSAENIYDLYIYQARTAYFSCEITFQISSSANRFCGIKLTVLSPCCGRKYELAGAAESNYCTGCMKVLTVDLPVEIHIIVDSKYFDPRTETYNADSVIAKLEKWINMDSDINVLTSFIESSKLLETLIKIGESKEYLTLISPEKQVVLNTLNIKLM